MFLKFTYKFLTFVGVFLLVVLGLYMDRFLILPLQTAKEIFFSGFPWNLMVLTAIIYFSASILSSTFRGLKRLI